ncbi:RodZ domain-containing protein [Stutzerimonas kunmingensis]|uniref:RodZ domain-containing protein n=1 Tax=Stutzerimonas kunmingensis TaxID=1211807 RepID=UPI00052B6B4F|nr:RodZ family helix-turn-helix domain-containing protein [Stutzerimonas kunmingensis]UIP33996.1 helix-turn-helix domain-containing protein [Stutzerimonas kunmingensis]CEG50752.1 Cro/CI family transcriptional regulator [Stutzerimonas xanthomarina]
MTAPHQESAAPMGNNPGETLRIAREDKGWPLSAVAQQLNLTERSLARIEAGDFSQLPGHTFARGYVRAYAKLLGLDQNRLVQEFDLHTGTNASGSNVNSLGRIEEPGRLSRSFMRFFGFALLLLLAAVAWYWWQERMAREATTPPVSALERIEVEGADGTTEIHLLDRADEGAEQQSEQPVEQTAPLADSNESEAIESEQQAPATTDVQGTITEPAGEAAESLPLTLPDSPTQSADATASQAPTSASNDTAPPVAGEAQLELSFTADCWTRVSDADGRVLFSALAKAGTSRAVSGKAPLDVHLGYARGAQLSYNGEAVNLASHMRGETARLKLGQ